MLGVGLIVNPDWTVDLDFPYRCLDAVIIHDFQVGPEALRDEDGRIVGVNWEIYFQRLVRTRLLVRQLYLQLKPMFGRNEIAPQLASFCKPWGNALPVWISEAEPAVAAKMKAAYRHVTPKAEVVNYFADHASTSAKIDASIFLHFTWSHLLSIPDLTASLGLHPDVVQRAIEITGIKLSYSTAADLFGVFQGDYTPPPQGTVIPIPLTKLNFETSVPGRMKQVREFSITVGSPDHARLKDQVMGLLEGHMKVQLRLPEPDPDATGDAMCMVCCATYRIGDVARWSFRPCCSHALCIECVDKSSRTTTRKLNLWPVCPFCRADYPVDLLNMFGSPETGPRGDYLEGLRGAIVGADTVGPADLRTSYNFSLCLGERCHRVIPTLRACGARDDDLPTLCSTCFSALPDADDTKKCDPAFGGCGTYISRIDGCNNVDCPCGKSICWLCGAILNVSHDENHFTDGYFGSSCAGGTFEGYGGGYDDGYDSDGW